VQLISTGDLAPSGDLAGERVGDESDATSLDIIHLESMGVNDQGRRALPPAHASARTTKTHRIPAQKMLRQLQASSRQNRCVVNVHAAVKCIALSLFY